LGLSTPATAADQAVKCKNTRIQKKDRDGERVKKKGKKLSSDDNRDTLLAHGHLLILFRSEDRVAIQSTIKRGTTKKKSR
jgi:hypothetical protein